MQTNNINVLSNVYWVLFWSFRYLGHRPVIVKTPVIASSKAGWKLRTISIVVMSENV